MPKKKTHDTNGTRIKDIEKFVSPLQNRITEQIGKLNMEFVKIIPRVSNENEMLFLRSPDIKRVVLREKILLLSDLLLNIQR